VNSSSIFACIIVDFLVMDNVFRCIILCIVWQSTVEDEWNSKDYLKREFSLVKPYSGFVNAAFRMFSVYLKSRPRPLVQRV